MEDSHTSSQSPAHAIGAFSTIMGRKNVLTSTRATRAYVTGNRFGGGNVLAVLRPSSLTEMWQALRVCIDHDLIVIPQSANTGLTGGSGPTDREYDRGIVVMSTLRINTIHLINDAREAVCLPGSALYELEQVLAPHGREPHSVIGSSSIGATVIGGIANNSGGSQVRKGPAYTEQAIYARVTADREIELVNHLGIELSGDPLEVLRRLELGQWTPEAVSPPPPDSHSTDYAQKVREKVPSPARYNADPQYLFEASGCAGKLLVFAVRVPTFPKDAHTTTFYVGTNHASELKDLRRAVLDSSDRLPISGEYMGRTAFDLAEKYGRDTFVGLKRAGSQTVKRLFALKSWANSVFARLPFLGETFADTVSQRLFSLLPTQLPQRMVEYRDRFEHHLILTVGNTERDSTLDLLTMFFDVPGRDGEFFICTEDEATSAMLNRFGAASAMTRFYNLNRRDSSALITFDVALRRDEDDWLEDLPPHISEQLIVSSYYGHFFCYVLHQDHVAKKGVDAVALKQQMLELLEQRGAATPAEHNYGHLYRAPAHLEDHYRELDPTNMFNPGIGGTSVKQNWA